MRERKSVLGPRVLDATEEQKKEYDGATIIKIYGERFFYTGPARISHTTSLARFFPGKELSKEQVREMVKYLQGFNNHDRFDEDEECYHFLFSRE